MRIRRPAAALLLALTLAGGPAVLTACGDPSGGNTSRNDGSTDDNTTNTDGADPGSKSQGSLPSEGQPGQTSSTDRNNNQDSDK